MKKQTPKGESTKRAVPFKLSDEDKSRKAEAAAELSQQLEVARDNKKTEMSKHNAKINDLNGRMTKLLQVIHDGTERREVTCTEVKNFDQDQVEYWFKGECMETRPMTEADRQIEMKVTDPKRRGKKTDDPIWRRRAPKYEPKNQAVEDDEREQEIARVHKLETSRSTASSAVD